MGGWEDVPIGFLGLVEAEVGHLHGGDSHPKRTQLGRSFRQGETQLVLVGEKKGG